MTPVRRRTARWLVTALAIQGIARAGSGTPPPAEVVIVQHHFAPSTVRVHAGQAVRWINRDGDAHAVLDVAGTFRSAGLDTGDSYVHIYPAPGHYRYFCALHPDMTGEVIVTP